MSAPRAFLIILMPFLLALSGCALFRGSPPEPAEPADLEHTVAYPGETLGLIASWYTGSSSNWKELRDFNAEIDLKRIRTGDMIRIPEKLLVRRDPMPKSFIRSFYKSRVLAKIPSATISGVQEDTILLNPAGDGRGQKHGSIGHGDEGHDRLLLKLLDEGAG